MHTLHVDNPLSQYYLIKDPQQGFVWGKVISVDPKRDQALCEVACPVQRRTINRPVSRRYLAVPVTVFQWVAAKAIGWSVNPDDIARVLRPNVVQ